MGSFVFSRKIKIKRIQGMSRSRPNIRTVYGAGRNPLLNLRYIRVQNRAAAVLDACEEFGEGYTIDLVAHLHRISVSQIETHLYGEPNVIERRFVFKSTIKLERVEKEGKCSIDCCAESCAFRGIKISSKQ